MTADFRIMRLKGSYETLGIVVDFLAGIEPFARYDLGNLVRMLQYQLHEGHHLAAVTRDRLVGYGGWLPTTVRAAEAWLADGVALAPLAAGAAPDAVVLTVVAADDRAALFSLFAELRRLSSFDRIYFKREYASRSRAPLKRVISGAQAS